MAAARYPRNILDGRKGMNDDQVAGDAYIVRTKFNGTEPHCDIQPSLDLAKASQDAVMV